VTFAWLGAAAGPAEVARRPALSPELVARDLAAIGIPAAAPGASASYGERSKASRNGC